MRLPTPEELPFLDHVDALHFAFHTEVKDRTPISTLFRTMQGGGVKIRPKLDLSREDRGTQGALIMSLVNRTLPPGPEKTAIYAYYTVPVAMYARRKVVACETIAVWINSQIGTPMWFTVDIIKGWARLKPSHNLKWWAEHLKVSERTCQRYAYGRSNKSPGIYTLLERAMGDADGKLVPAMRDCQLIP